MKKRLSETHEKPPASEERTHLISEIIRLREEQSRMQKRMQDQRVRIQKTLESNQRNEKRLLRYRARMEEMNKHKNSPQHFLAVTGYMTEAIQEFIISHNYELHDNPNDLPNPDNMTYEQLLDLGEQIGKVSKGLSKEQIELLSHRRVEQSEDKCPICQNNFEREEIVIDLPCRHYYHDECILYWLREENTCPLCKTSLVHKE